MFLSDDQITLFLCGKHIHTNHTYDEYKLFPIYMTTTKKTEDRCFWTKTLLIFHISFVARAMIHTNDDFI